MNYEQRKSIEELTRRVDRVQKGVEDLLNPKVRVNLEDYVGAIDDVNEAQEREAARIRGDMMPLSKREKEQRRF